MPYVILGPIVALGLFFGVLVHELAHSLVARSKGIAINNITLMIFGGIASMEEGVPDPKVELPDGAGRADHEPLLRHGLLAGSSTLVPSDDDRSGLAGVLIFVFGYLGVLNIILCAFNLIPAFPMDGGRVLRAIPCKKDAPSPGNPDRGRYRQGVCHPLWYHRALSSSPRS